MDVDDVLRGDAAGPGRSLDGELHRVDVGQDLGGLRPHAAARLLIDLSSGEGARIDLHPLDFRRGDRLGSEEEAGQRHELRTRAAVEIGDRLLGIGDDTRYVSRHLKAQVGQREGDEGLVRAGSTIAGRRIQGGIVLPDTTDEIPSHWRPNILSQEYSLVKDTV